MSFQNTSAFKRLASAWAKHVLQPQREPIVLVSDIEPDGRRARSTLIDLVGAGYVDSDSVNKLLAGRKIVGGYVHATAQAFYEITMVAPPIGERVVLGGGDHELNAAYVKWMITDMSAWVIANVHRYAEMPSAESWHPYSPAVLANLAALRPHGVNGIVVARRKAEIDAEKEAARQERIDREIRRNARYAIAQFTGLDTKMVETAMTRISRGLLSISDEEVRQTIGHVEITGAAWEGALHALQKDTQEEIERLQKKLSDLNEIENRIIEAGGWDKLLTELREAVVRDYAELK